MTMTLTLANIEKLANNQSTRLTLDRHGALIGRSPSADWTLPDANNYISYTHCEIVYRNGSYILNDKSTNGTFVNQAHERLSGPHTLSNGDELAIGHYRILVHISELASTPEPAAPASPAQTGWGWDESPEPQPANTSWGDDETEVSPQWNFDSPAAAISGRGPLRENFAPPRALQTSSANDVWSRYAASNAIDWEAGGFGSRAKDGQHEGSWPPERQAKQDEPARLEPQRAHETEPSVPPAELADHAPAPASLASPGSEDAWTALLNAAGLTPADLKSSPSRVGMSAGKVLLRLVAGLIVMLEARARAKAELGALSTTIELAGNNPLKFTRDPQLGMARLLNPPERGFMDAEHAVEDAFKDLQAHQMATLAAMQGALRATLRRFSPEAVRGRAKRGDMLARILPAARAAALWYAYEREFEGVVRGSDEAFMETFARNFRDAYQKACAEMRK